MVERKTKDCRVINNVKNICDSLQIRTKNYVLGGKLSNEFAKQQVGLDKVMKIEYYKDDEDRVRNG